MPPRSTSRREFLQATVVAGTLAGVPDLHAAGSDLLRVGLVGCGDRGTGAATPGARRRSQCPARRHGRCLRGSAAAEPGPLEAGREGRVEGRCRSRSPLRGLRRLPEAPRERRRRGLALHAAALPAHASPGRGRGRQARLRGEAGRRRCPRRPLRARELQAGKDERPVGRLGPLPALRPTDSARPSAGIHDGATGEVTTLLANDYRSGRWAKPKQPHWTEMYYQMRNWYNFTWLSGDFNVEQHVHFLDVCAVHGQEHAAGDRGPHGRLHRPGDHLGNGPELPENLGPDRYDWNGAPPVVRIAIPGQTPFA